MKKPQYFAPWITNRKWLVYIFLFFLLMTGLVQFGLFALNQSYVVAYFGAQPEDVTFCMQITYAAIIAFLPIQFRLVRYFETRNYLITIFICGIAISIASMFTKDIYVFMLCRILTGFVAASIAGCILTLLFSMLKPVQMHAIGSTIFYGSSLASVVLVGLLTSYIADNMNWQMVYLYIIALQIVAMLVALLLLNKKNGAGKYPLYQIDWISFLLAFTLLSTLGILFIYGPKFYWFDDSMIQALTVLAFIVLCMFIVRQSLRKRPYLHLHIFKSKHFLMGIALLGLYYGMKDSINLVYGFAAVVLKWNSQDVILLGTLNILGMAITMIIASFLMIRYKNLILFFLLTGLGSMLVYHWWMYTIFSSDLSFADLSMPVILQGAASGLLFVPIVAFSLSKLPAYTGFSGITVAAVSRFIGILNGAAGYYTLQLFYNQSYVNNFLNRLTTTNTLYIERLQSFNMLYASKGYSPDQANALAQANLYKGMTVQSQLLTNMTVFKCLSIFLLALIIIILLVILIKNLSHKNPSKAGTAILAH